MFEVGDLKREDVFVKEDVLVLVLEFLELVGDLLVRIEVVLVFLVFVFVVVLVVVFVLWVNCVCFGN